MNKDGMFWIAVLRIIVGAMFLTTWLNNIFEGLYTPDGLLNFFTVDFPQINNPLGFYAGFINNFILPIRALFAPFQFVTEFLLGAALVAGLFTPLASLAGIFFLINTFLATFGHDWPWAYFLPIAILAVTCLSRAGRRAGLDAFFYKRLGEKGILY